MEVLKVSQSAEITRFGKRNIDDMKILRRIERYLLVFAVCISACAISGCIESSFTLANESRLPTGMVLPPGLTRADVSVTMNCYVMPRVKFIMKDKRGKTLAEVTGKELSSNPLHLKRLPDGFDPDYPMYEVVVARGKTEIIEQRRREPIFYVNDDPAVREELLEACGKTH